MKPRKTRNLEMLAVVAQGLRGLREKVVFVGGATIDLYLSDPAAGEGRATDDVDCVVELASRPQYYALEEELRALGFKHPMGKEGPICRWEYRGIQVDVMPTEGQALGFGNRWYADGVAKADRARLPDGCVEAKEKVFGAPAGLRSYLKEKLKGFLADSRFVEAVHGHIRIAEKGEDRVGRALQIVSELAA